MNVAEVLAKARDEHGEFAGRKGWCSWSTRCDREGVEIKVKMLVGLIYAGLGDP